MHRTLWNLSYAATLAAIAVVIPAREAGADANPLQASPMRMAGQAPAITPHFFATVAVPIPARRFWSNWERARRDASDVPQMQRLVSQAKSLVRREQIAFVQAAVARNIKWRSDTTQYGRHDYWASAAETLASRRGDSEDRAIVKMQALRALGVPTSDLYLTLGRDTVAGPVTVLIVRDGPTYLVLDDTGGPPYTPDWRPEFQPVLTFGYGASWVHKPASTAARIIATAKPYSSATSDGN